MRRVFPGQMRPPYHSESGFHHNYLLDMCIQRFVVQHRRKEVMHSKYVPEMHKEYGFPQRLYVWTKMRFIAGLQETGLSLHEIAAELNARGQHAIDRTPWNADAVNDLVSLAEKIHQHDLKQGISAPCLS